MTKNREREGEWREQRLGEATGRRSEGMKTRKEVRGVSVSESASLLSVVLN